MPRGRPKKQDAETIVEQNAERVEALRRDKEKKSARKKKNEQDVWYEIAPSGKINKVVMVKGGTKYRTYVGNANKEKYKPLLAKLKKEGNLRTKF